MYSNLNPIWELVQLGVACSRWVNALGIACGVILGRVDEYDRGGKNVFKPQREATGATVASPPTDAKHNPDTPNTTHQVHMSVRSNLQREVIHLLNNVYG